MLADTCRAKGLKRLCLCVVLTVPYLVFIDPNATDELWVAEVLKRTSLCVVATVLYLFVFTAGHWWVVSYWKSIRLLLLRSHFSSVISSLVDSQRECLGLILWTSYEQPKFSVLKRTVFWLRKFWLAYVDTTWQIAWCHSPIKHGLGKIWLNLCEPVWPSGKALGW